MRFVRGHGEARLFPSRHDHALFRLVAYLRLRSARPQAHQGMLVIDRHQTSRETWIVACWIVATIACYLMVPLRRLPLAAAAAIALPLAILVSQVLVMSVGLTLAPLLKAITGTRILPWRINNAGAMVALMGVSVYFANRPSWVRFVAWQFLGLLVLNAIAAGLVFLLRDSIARLEASVGGSSSGL